MNQSDYRNGYPFRKIEPTGHRYRMDNSFAKQVVPKLGPIFQLNLKDTVKLKHIALALQSNNPSSISPALNFLLGWSATVKDLEFQDDILEVVCALLDLISSAFQNLTVSPIDHLKLAQYSSLESDQSMQASAAGMILKNFLLSSEKRFQDYRLNSKAVSLLYFVLMQRHEMMYTLIRDLLLLCKKLTNYHGLEQSICHGLTELVLNSRLPLRLRIAALDALSELMMQEGMKEMVLETLGGNVVEMRMNLRSFMLLPVEEAKREAAAEFDGVMDYEGLAILSEEETSAQREEELKIWSCKLHSESLLSSAVFLKSIGKSEIFEKLAGDESLLQVLVDLTTGKKISELSGERRGILDSKHMVMMMVRRNIHSSEMQAYKTILDLLQGDSLGMKKKLKVFEKEFALGAFETTWQAKQCAIILSLMKGIP